MNSKQLSKYVKLNEAGQLMLSNAVENWDCQHVLTIGLRKLHGQLPTWRF